MARDLIAKGGRLSKEKVLNYFKKCPIIGYLFNPADTILYREIIYPAVAEYISNGDLNIEDIRKYVKQSMVHTAKSEYNRVVQGGLPHDPYELDNNLANSRCFAWAINNGVFSREQLEKIPLGLEGEILDVFVREHEIKDFLGKCVNDFMNPRYKQELIDFGDFEGDSWIDPGDAF